MLSQLLTFAAGQALAAGVPAFDPRQHKQDIAGEPAQVLVLGSPHLSQLPETLDPKLLKPLLERLERFRPEYITVEGLSGEQCDGLRRFKAQHGSAWDDYCWPTDDVEKATGLTIAQAAAEVDKTLASWPVQPTHGQRRRLAMLFLAAGDRASATVQWLRLPPEERRPGDGLDQNMAEIIERRGKKPNENYAIGAALAARLRLERVYLADDHTADTPFDEKSAEGQAYAAAIQRVWNPPERPPVFAEFLRRQADLKTSGDVIALYRFLNDPETQRATISSDMGAAARMASAQPYGRQYLAWWETRNLRMAANVRAAFQKKPGARVLVIVGSTHKGHMDAYLDMMQDVQLVDAMQFLR